MMADQRLYKFFFIFVQAVLDLSKFFIFVHILIFVPRLYKLVKWCKSLPLFKNILIDDQVIITLLIKITSKIEKIID